MEFDELALDVRADGRGGFDLDLRSPFGAAMAPLVLPCGLEDLAGWIAAIEEQVRRTSPAAADRRRPAEVEAEAAELGRALFGALLQSPLSAKLYRCLGRLEELLAREVEQGLRLRLTFRTDSADPADSETLGGDVSPIAALPWELLWDPETRDFLGRSRYTPIVRSITTSCLVRPPLLIPSPVRVLAVSAAPLGCHDLPSIDEEVAAIRRALEERAVVDFDFLDHATLPRLAERLRAAPVHVLHFLGHGRFSEPEGEGALAFETEDRSLDPVSGPRLADVIRDAHSLQLVVLNACGTGAMPRRRGQDPYSCVATGLVKAGVPAVVAMQFRIPDSIAATFSAELYARLAADDPLEIAMAEARRRIPRECLHWATPVLFLQAEDGHLLALGPEARPQNAPAPSLRLGIRSFIGWDRDMYRHTDRLLCVDPYFEHHRFLREPALWSEKIWPDLDRFLTDAVEEERSLSLRFAAHGTIAFAAGYCIEAKAGVEITLRQPGAAGAPDWKVDQGEVPPGPLWQQPLPERIFDEEGTDLAVAIGITHPVSEDVAEYLAGRNLRLRRLILAEIAPEPGSLRILSGAHAFQLADQLARSVRQTRSETGVLHLFASGPNGFQFYLGRLARRWGAIQLYEHDFERKRHGSYEPSLALPQPATAREGGRG